MFSGVVWRNLKYYGVFFYRCKDFNVLILVLILFFLNVYIKRMEICIISYRYCIGGGYIWIFDF